MNHRIGIIMMVCCLLFVELKAQESNPKIDSTVLQEVVVTATRNPTNSWLVPFSITKQASPIQSIRNPRTTPEALMQTAGVFVQKTNHGGGSAFVRGFTGNQTLLMLDGIRLNNATFRYGPNQYLNTIDAFSVASIEVVKGSGSVQYGSDAMGGVIQLFSYDPGFSEKTNWFGSTVVRATNQQMEQSVRVQTGISQKRLVLYGGITKRNFGDLVGGDSTGRQSPSGYKEQDWDLHLKWNFANKWNLKISSQKLVQKEIPLYHKVRLENYVYYNFDPQSLLFNHIDLEWRNGSKWIHYMNVKLFQKQSEEGRNYWKNTSTITYNEYDKVDTKGLIAEVKSVFNSYWSANSGIEWYHDQVNSSRKKRDLLSSSSISFVSERGLYPDHSIQQSFSAYSLHHLTLATWRVETGLRYNYLTNVLPAEFIALGTSQVNTSNKMHPKSLVGNLSVLKEIANKQVIFASISTNYRAPNIDDMGTLGLVDFRYEIPSYDLQPEKTYNYELGYRYFGNKFRVSLTGYYMEIRDLISRVKKGTDLVQGYPVYIKTNDQVGYIKGLESEYSLVLAKNWKWKGYISTQYGHNITRKEPMRRIPPTNGLNAISYEQSKINFSIEHQWALKQDRLAQGDKDDNRIPKGGTPGWQLWNFYASYRLGAVKFQFSLNNLGNTDYRLHGSGINGMGRAATVSVRYDW